jgi:hypothetical protein
MWKQALILAALFALARPAEAEQIYLYDRPGFVGNDFEATDSMPDLSTNPVTTHAVSLRARTGAWLACSEPNFGGNCLWIAHAQIFDLTPWGLAGNIRSLRLYRTHGERFHWPTRLHLYGADYIHDSVVIAENVAVSSNFYAAMTASRDGTIAAYGCASKAAS